MTQQRRYHRITFEADVIIHISGESQPATTVNLSQGGALLHTTSPLEFGQRLHLEIQLPMVNETSNIPGVVRWRRDSSVGVQFETLRAIEVWGINQLINTRK